MHPGLLQRQVFFGRSRREVGSLDLGFLSICHLFFSRPRMGVFSDRPSVHHQFLRRVPFEFGKRLEGCRFKMFVEVRERRIQLRQDIGWILITVCVGPVIPGASAEDTPFGFVA